VTDEQEEFFPKICYTPAPMKLDRWWMVYFRDSAKHRDIRKLEEAVHVSSRMNRSINDSNVHFSETELDGSRVGDSAESEFEWKVARNITDLVVEGRVLPDKWNADSKETEGEDAAEKRRVENWKDGINVGEY
jgi:hypothetical protein